MTFVHLPPPWVLAGLIVAVLSAALVSYRSARAVLSPRRRWSLTALRALTLLLLLAVLMRPVRLAPADRLGGLVPILVDASASMSLADVDRRSRFQVALDLARTRIVGALEPTFAAELFSFGERLEPLRDGETSPVARESRLDTALEELSVHLQGRRPAGVVVISDGAVQVGDGELPSELAGVPIHAFVVGADQPTRDREVLGLTVGDARLRESLVELSALVVAHGEGAPPLEVTLMQNGQPIEVRRVVPAGDGVPQRVVFQVAPSRDAPTVYAVEVAEGDGELTTLNNRQHVLAAPAGTPRRVLMIEGAPGHEHSFLKRTLDEDPGLLVDAVVRQGENDQGEPTFFVQASADRAAALAAGFPATREALFAYDAVVLANVEPATLPREALGWLVDFVGRRGGGLVVLGARSFDASGLAGSPLEPVIPVSLAARAAGVAVAGRGPREALRVALTGDGESHPVMRLGSSVDQTRAAWEAAPALAAVAALGDARPGGLLLAITAAPGGVLRPLVGVHRYGRGRALAFAGEASWRWKMMLPASNPLYDRFWRQAVRWTSADATPPVAVAVSADGGRRVSVSAEVRDAQFQPVPDAEIRLQIADASGRVVELTAGRVAATGAFTASFDAQASGVHTITVSARKSGVALGTAQGWVLVGGVEGEFVSPRRQLDQLALIAHRTGGRMFTDADTDGLAAALARPQPAGHAPVQREVWHSFWVWLVIVALLGGEWTLRRRWGLR